MFERFTKAARDVVTQAVAIATVRGDPAISTEHLLAGIAASDSPAAVLLDRLGAGSDRVRSAISDLDREALAAVGIDQDMIPVDPAGNEWLKRKRHLPFTGAAKRALQGALREATRFQHRYIGTEHILAALTFAGNEDPARRILAGLGIDIVRLRDELLMGPNP
jgi:hypothetical protein